MLICHNAHEVSLKAYWDLSRPLFWLKVIVIVCYPAVLDIVQKACSRILLHSSLCALILFHL